jgi:hypothetical protein
MKKLFKQKTWAVLLGFFAFVWFLVRVIPKPSRAAYPCQRAAFPLASGFIIWLIVTTGSVGILRKSKQLFKNKMYAAAFFLLIIGTGLFFIITDTYSPRLTSASSKRTAASCIPVEGPNVPVGKGKGVNPGRVAWVYNPDATSWDGKTGRWWSDHNTNQEVVDSMVDQAIALLTGNDDLEDAYNEIFRYFNSTNGKGDIAYTTGEKIAIKVNMNTCRLNNCDHNEPKTSPHLLLAHIRHLVDIVGVMEQDITVYDISRQISDDIYAKVSAGYPDVKYVDHFGKTGIENWSAFKVDYDCPLKWSEKLTLENEGGNPTYLPQCVSQAAYIINIADLKGHGLTGITLCAKNHFGTFYSYSPATRIYGPKAAGVHPYVAVHEMGRCGGQGSWDFCVREMGTYTPLVDIMGHEHLGGKTLLFILDALYCAPVQQGEDPIKWEMSPFNNDWTSSVFVSQDGVAIESVGFDFLRNEPTQYLVSGPVENYVHEAANADQPPSGHFYDPENDGSRLQSLGVHEHWNNATDKQYSGNLNSGEGIELVHNDFSLVTAIQPLQTMQNEPSEIRIYPLPVKTHMTIETGTVDKMEATIISIAGEVMFKQNVVGKSSIDLARLKPGVYIVRITGKNGSFNQTIIKE